jgi:hypothetical protein
MNRKVSTSTTCQSRARTNNNCSSEFTVNSFLRLKEEYVDYLCQSPDQTLHLVNFLSNSVLEELIEDQYNKGFIGRDDLDIRSILGVSDKMIYCIIADYLRPKSVQEYKEKLFSGITDVEKILPKNSSDLSFEEYAEVVCPLVSRVCAEIQAIDDLFHYKANSDDLRHFPKQGYNMHGERSVNILLDCFPFLDSNFWSYIVEDDLRCVKCAKDLVAIMLAANDLMFQEIMIAVNDQMSQESMTFMLDSMAEHCDKDISYDDYCSDLDTQTIFSIPVTGTNSDECAPDLLDVLITIEKGEMKNRSCQHDKDHIVNTSQMLVSNKLVPPLNDMLSVVTDFKITFVAEELQNDEESFNNLGDIVSVEPSYLLTAEVDIKIWDPGGCY